MCNTCRDRYKNYGVTKRAKWKAERIAFDQELENLRREEDERRAKAGLVPLSSSPEELRSWELSIVDEKVTLPPTLANVLSSVASNAIASSSSYSLNLAQILAPLDQLDSAQAAQLAHLMRLKLESKTGGSSGAAVAGQSSTSEENQLSEVQSDVSSSWNETGTNLGAGIEQETSGSSSNTLLTSLVLPQRMCTVSHCHTILPGHYLYKRCDRHRYQNRKHGKLKRFREKVIKGKGPDTAEDGGEEGVIDPDVILKDDSEPFDSEEVEKKKLEAKARERAKQLILARNSSDGKRAKALKGKGEVVESNEDNPNAEPNAVESETEDVDGTMNDTTGPSEVIGPRDCGSNHLV
ncbi:hypothetical protein L218DRAFT_835968, partial [Marasmius fiardii PR-910]